MSGQVRRRCTHSTCPMSTLSVHQVLLGAYGLAVLLTVLLVTGRLGWCAILAVRARRIRVAALAVAGMVCVAVLLASVLAWWFLLGVSHRQKDVGDTYAVMAGTGIPYISGVLRPVAAGRSISVAAPARCRRKIEPAGSPNHHQALQPRDSDIACGHRLLRSRGRHCRHPVAPSSAAGRAGFEHAAPATGCHGLACGDCRCHRCSRAAGPARLSASAAPGWTMTVKAMSSSTASLSPDSVWQGTRKKLRAPGRDRKPPANVRFRPSSQTAATIT
ncbi:MAG: hypothetical protein HONDAALG_01243 [Gammaproteobacteria bacterium]|nr:hypothetical protein [Gammaproteobacteria bacterium]